MQIPSIGIRQRMLLFGLLPALLILGCVLWLNYQRLRSLLFEFSEENLRDRVRQVAADIDRGTLEAVTTARTMAIAAESGLFGDRPASLAYAKGVLEANPQFCGAYFGYEPDADGLDKASLEQASRDDGLPEK